jgi:hypothetical protein
MKDTLIKLQIESLEQQLRVLKAKVTFKKKKKKTLSDLYGIFENKINLSLEEIKKHEYSVKDKP